MASPAFSIRQGRPDEGPRVVEIWRAAVAATHDFLSQDDLEAIDRDATAYLLAAPLWVAVDAQDRPVGFMGLCEDRLESLFIDPEFRAHGIGRSLVSRAASLHAILDTEVNAQNAQAVGFYRRLGFVETGYSALDDQGRPYPLIRMRFERASKGAAVSRSTPSA